MKLDDNFLSWLSKRNITQDTDGDFVKKCLYTWWGTIRQQVPNLKKSSDNHIQYISVFLEYYTIWLDTLDQNSRERAPEVTEILEQINKKYIIKTNQGAKLFRSGIIQIQVFLNMNSRMEPGYNPIRQLTKNY